MFKFIRSYQTCQKWWCHFTFPTAMCECAAILHSKLYLLLSNYLITVFLVSMNYYLMVLFAFPWWLMILNIFHVLICHPFIFIGKRSAHIFYPFLKHFCKLCFETIRDTQEVAKLVHRVLMYPSSSATNGYICYKYNTISKPRN